MNAELLNKINIKPQTGNRWCNKCKQTTKHRLSFDIAENALIAMCLKCLSINERMSPSDYDKYVAEWQQRNKKTVIAVQTEIKNNSTIKKFVEKIDNNLKVR